MIAILAGLFALGAVVVLVWRGLREPKRSRRSTAGDEERVSTAWLDDETRRRGDD